MRQVRHAFEYLLRRDGVGRHEYKEISLLLRLQMLKLAQHDLCFVQVRDCFLIASDCL